MKKTKIMAFLMSAVMLTGIFPVAGITSFAADGAADSAEYAYFMNTSEESVYVWLGEEIEEHGVEFLDGQRMGITESNNVYYNETVALDGLYARKQYNANASYFKIDESFYEEGDTRFLFSIVYYDFGPSEGTYYFEYHTTDGETQRVTLIKPGRNPGWSVKTIVVDDADLSKTYDNGATIQIVNGAYNAFKKIEVVNLSKAKRENKPVEITALGNEIRREAESLRIVDYDDERFVNAELSKPCTMYDAYTLRNLITVSEGKVSNDAKNYTMTQGELLDYYMQSLGVAKSGGESSVDAAKRLGIIDAMDYFTADEWPALNYHLLSLVHAALLYENPNGVTLLKGLIKSGFYDGVDIATVKTDKFAEVYFQTDADEPIYLPYETITDPQTKRTYHYINMFGSNLYRGYLNVNSWLPDGSGFLCGLESGVFYLYDIESQTLTYLDKTIKTTQPPLYMCLDGWVYYPKNEKGIYSIWRVHPETLEKEMMYELPKGVTVNYHNMSNDGRYCVIDGTARNDVVVRPEDTTAIIRLDLQEKKLEYQYWSFDTPGGNLVNHFQINPEYPDIVAFSHETDTSKYSYADVTDRCNIMDLTTGNVITYNQGRYDNGKCVQLLTHEVWSYDGEYRYFCSWATDGTKEHGTMPAIVRINKDGTHRQYYYAGMPTGGVNHANISGDNKMLCSDEQWLSLISTETHQVFPIANMRSVIGMKNHPYHPHPHVSYSGNMASWGHVHDGVLGIAWLDYTDILENEVGKGGRYEFGDCVTRVSYKGVECESRETVKDGVECASVAPGKELFLDINADITDTDNGAVKITFDYYDNTTKPLTITYSKGVEEYNDAWKYFNKTVDITRRGTNKWKTAEIVIDCGNFENIGKFESDFKIKSGALNAYIANVKVEAIEK